MQERAPSDASDEGRPAWLLGLLVVALALQVVILPLSDGLSTTEAAAAFLAAGDAPLARVARFEGGPPLYYVLLSSVGGGSELGWRWPSLVCAAVGCAALFALARRGAAPGGTLGPWTAVGVWVTGAGVGLGSVGPLACGLALTALATLSLVRWLERPGVLRAGSYALLALLLLGSHGPCATALVAHAVWVATRPSRERPPGAQQLLVGGLVLAVGLAGALRWLPELAGTSARPLGGDLLRVLVPTVVLGGGLTGLALAWPIWRDGLTWRDPGPPEQLALPALLLVIPPLVLWLGALTVGSPFEPEACLQSGLCGAAWSTAWVSRGIRPTGARALVSALVLAAGWGAAPPRSDDWRRAGTDVAACLTSGTLLLTPAALPVRRGQPLSEADWQEWQAAPLRYGLGRPTPIEVVPSDSDDEGAARLEEVARRATQASGVVLVRTEVGATIPVWFEGRLAAAGWTARRTTTAWGELAVYLPGDDR